MDKNREQTEQAQIMKEKEIKRTLRKARVRKNASPEQAKARLISYVGKAKLGKYNLRFPDEYLADPQFLLGLYKANENMFIHEKSWFTDKDLLENVDFVLEYTRLRHASVMKNRVDNFRDFELKNIIDEYSDVMTNPEFVIKFAEEYPHINVFPMMKRASIKSYSSADRDSASKKQQDLERYKKCLASLPTEFLCKWSRMEGAKVLGYIPTDTPNYTEILSAGIERDGFMSLEKLELSQVLDNVDLVVKAYEKDGIRALSYYIETGLSPRRTYYYMPHGEPQDYVAKDQKYVDVQKALVATPEIKNILEREEIMAHIKEETITKVSLSNISHKDKSL